MDLYTEYLLHEFDEIESDYVFVNLWDGVIGQPMKYGAVADLFSRVSKKGCVAKTGGADGRVRNCVCLLSSPCPSPTPSNGVIMSLKLSYCACVGT